MKKAITVFLLQTKWNIWDLSAHLDVKYQYLIDYLFGENPVELSADVKQKLIKLMIHSNYCPECGMMYRNEGTCKVCFCGWSLC